LGVSKSTVQRRADTLVVSLDVERYLVTVARLFSGESYLTPGAKRAKWMGYSATPPEMNDSMSRNQNHTPKQAVSLCCTWLGAFNGR